jgi:serine/threonine protein kinase
MKNPIGQVLLNRYRVDAFVALGGMGAVYRVWDTVRGVPLAMKLLNPELAEDPKMFRRFEREARLLEKLNHPHIVPFYGLFRTHDFCLILERFIDGFTLKDLLQQRRNRPLPLHDILTYFKALCAALGFAHVNGVIHCDVKPGNVMVERGGQIYLTDFGVARYNETTTTTLAGAGTPAYMAPEQIRGEKITPSTDVYALGLVLYELLAGRRPFTGEEKTARIGGETLAARIRFAHQSIRPPDPRLFNSTITAPLAQAVLKALNKNPDERYGDMRTFYLVVCQATGVQPEQVGDRVETTVPMLDEAIQTAPQSDYDEIPSVSKADISPEAILPAALITRRHKVPPLIWAGMAIAVIVLMVFLLPTGGSPTPTANPTPDLSQISMVLPTSTMDIPVLLTNAAPTHPPSLPPTHTPVPDTPVPLPTFTSRPPDTAIPTSSSSSNFNVQPYFPIPGCAASRLHLRDTTYVALGGKRNAIRSYADTNPSENIIGYASEGEVMEVLGGPKCNYGWILWEIRTAGGLQGWTPESDGSSFFLEPMPSRLVCSGAPKTHLEIGMQAFVGLLPPVPNRVRKDAGGNGKVLGQIPPGGKMRIIDGPECRDNLVWWKVEAPSYGLIGWTAEGDSSGYWLLPIR